MPTVKLIVNRWLRESLNMESTDSGEIAFSVSEGESILEMVHRLATEKDDIWKRIAADEGRAIHMDVLVILNGRIVNLHDRGEATLQEGDEVMFLPMTAGG